MKPRVVRPVAKRGEPRHKFWPARNQYNHHIHVDAVARNRDRKRVRRMRTRPEAMAW